MSIVGVYISRVRCIYRAECAYYTHYDLQLCPCDEKRLSFIVIASVAWRSAFGVD